VPDDQSVVFTNKTEPRPQSRVETGPIERRDGVRAFALVAGSRLSDSSARLRSSSLGVGGRRRARRETAGTCGAFDFDV